MKFTGHSPDGTNGVWITLLRWHDFHGTLTHRPCPLPRAVTQELRAAVLTYVVDSCKVRRSQRQVANATTSVLQQYWRVAFDQRGTTWHVLAGISPRTLPRHQLGGASCAARVVGDAVIRVLTAQSAAQLASSAAGGDFLELPRGDEAFKFKYSLVPDPATATVAVPHVAPGSCLYVFRVHSSGVLDPWVVVGPSAALQLVGVEGLGVYGWSDRFVQDMAVGVYVGSVLGATQHPNVQRLCTSEPHSVAPWDTLIELQGHLISGRHSPYTERRLDAWVNGTVLFPEEHVDWPGMHAHLMNDAHRIRGCHNNVQVTQPDGVVQALCSIPPFDTRLALCENIASELLWDYGDTFWSGR